MFRLLRRITRRRLLDLPVRPGLSLLSCFPRFIRRCLDLVSDNDTRVRIHLNLANARIGYYIERVNKLSVLFLEFCALHFAGCFRSGCGTCLLHRDPGLGGFVRLLC